MLRRPWDGKAFLPARPGDPRPALHPPPQQVRPLGRCRDPSPPFPLETTLCTHQLPMNPGGKTRCISKKAGSNGNVHHLARDIHERLSRFVKTSVHDRKSGNKGTYPVRDCLACIGIDRCRLAARSLKGSPTRCARSSKGKWAAHAGTPDAQRYIASGRRTRSGCGSALLRRPCRRRAQETCNRRGRDATSEDGAGSGRT
jgi:hypothetical protein